jgi:hypothetical protein
MKTRLILPALAFALSILPCPAADKAEVETRARNYHAAGKSIVEMTITKKIDAATLEKQVDILVTEAVWFAEQYAKSQPKGQKLIKTVVDNVGTMKKLSFKELEHQWHDGHFFDGKAAELGVDLKEEENEHFTDPIHTLVHPLLVLKAGQAYATSKSDDDLKNMKEEMEEGLEQMEKQKTLLLK